MKNMEERRYPIICSNCQTPMVGTNKYIIQENNIYVWYVCPRRKANGEKGCGHISPIKINRIKEGKPIVDDRLVGRVKWSEAVTMFLQDNYESFDAWLHKHRDKFKDKKVEITVRVIE